MEIGRYAAIHEVVKASGCGNVYPNGNDASEHLKPRAVRVYVAGRHSANQGGAEEQTL